MRKYDKQKADKQKLVEINDPLFHNNEYKSLQLFIGMHPIALPKKIFNNNIINYIKLLHNFVIIVNNYWLFAFIPFYFRTNTNEFRYDFFKLEDVSIDHESAAATGVESSSLERGMETRLGKRQMCFLSVAEGREEKRPPLPGERGDHTSAVPRTCVPTRRALCEREFSLPFIDCSDS